MNVFEYESDQNGGAHKCGQGRESKFFFILTFEFYKHKQGTGLWAIFLGFFIPIPGTNFTRAIFSLMKILLEHTP